MTSESYIQPIADDLRRRVHRGLRSLPHPPRTHARDPISASPTDEVPPQVLREALERLAANAPHAAHLLQERYVRNRTAADVAVSLGVSDAEFYRRQQQAIDLLTAVVQRDEAVQFAGRQAKVLGHLEPQSYNQLVGAEAHLNRLQELVADRKSNPLICITGLGGLGKTALADGLVRRMLARGELDGAAWITARQRMYALDGSIFASSTPVLSNGRLLSALWDQLLPHLPAPLDPTGPALGELEVLLRHLGRTLVVVDNLETAEDVGDLVPLLRRLAQGVRFLLTSRHTLLAGGNLYQYPLPPLSREHALELLRGEAQAQNLPDLANAPDDELDRIFDVVGGHPLALRLVVGQLQLRALPEVLAALEQGDTASAEMLYSFIYAHAWAELDGNARSVLLALPQAPPTGASSTFLAAITGLPLPVVQESLSGLVKRNLVERRGGLALSHYTIHGLTRTFLQTHVLRRDLP
jgi:hypothetical protein